MKFTVAAENPLSYSCRALVAGCFEKEYDDPVIASFDAALGGALCPLMTEGEFTGKLNRTLLVHTLGRTAPDRLLLVGLGRRKDLTGDRMRQAAGTALTALRTAGMKGSHPFSTGPWGEATHGSGPRWRGFCWGDIRSPGTKRRETFPAISMR
jgi:hypothetical protein